MAKKKICSKCGEEKNISEFSKAKTGKYGVRGDCKQCRNKDYSDNKERVLNQRKEYYQDNKERIIKRENEYYQKNKNSIIIQTMKHNKKRDNTFRKRIGIGYRGIHQYIKRYKLRLDYCEECGIETTDLHLHSINHKYTRNPLDWIYLCSSCRSKLHNKLKGGDNYSKKETSKKEKTY